MKAFPASGNYTEEHNGMDLRDYFAAKAMQSLINDEKLKSTIIEMNEKISKVIPKLAYDYADAMMKAREQ